MKAVAIARMNMNNAQFEASEHFHEFMSIMRSGLGDEFTKVFLKCCEERDRDNVEKIYLITFTLKPGYTPETVKSAEAMVHSTGLREALHIKKYIYVKEYTKNTVPHWHALLITSRSLKKSQFNKYTLKYGNIDISLTKNSKNSDIYIQEYISKEGTPVIVV